MIRNDSIEEAAPGDCPGWKGPEECPPDRKFNPNHSACQECEKDALEAMVEEKERCGASGLGGK